MSYAALSSGGKDSILAIQKAFDSDLDVKYIVTVRPRNPHSYMFHSANLNAVRLIAENSGIQYHEIYTDGEKEVELDDLRRGLHSLQVEGLITGAIESVYQRDRIAAITKDLGIQLVSPLWHMDPLKLMQEVASRLKALIVVVAADGLGEELLGSLINESLISKLLKIREKRHIHLAGEGGEYESLTLYAPFMKQEIVPLDPHIKSTAGRSELIFGAFQ